jgi:hypothetical protein
MRADKLRTSHDFVVRSFASVTLCSKQYCEHTSQGFEYSNVYRGMAEKKNIADETKA